MSEMVERGAQAAFLEASKQNELWFSNLAWKDVPQLHEVFYASTRAVIKAMREPTEGMMNGGADAFVKLRGGEGTWVSFLEVQEIWQAMIDAALEDPK